VIKFENYQTLLSKIRTDFCLAFTLNRCNISGELF